jgi:tetratricopeptide (TPR) repeat protein
LIGIRTALAVPLRLSLLFLLLCLGLAACDKIGETPAKIQADAQRHIDRSASYRQQGQFRAAIIEARNALQLTPNDPAAMATLANLLNDLGQGRQAIKLLEPLAKQGNTAVIHALGEAYLNAGKYQSALDYLRAAQQNQQLGNDETLQYGVARALLGLGEFEAARPALQILHNSSRYGIQAQLRLLEIDLRRGDADDGRTRLQQMLQQHPHNVEVLQLAAAQAERDDNLEVAEDLLSRALLELPQTDILAPQKALVLERLTTVLTKRGRSGEALIYSKVLADANPEGALLQEKFQQGLALFQEGKLDEAELALAEVYQSSHNDMAAMLLGIIKYAKNDLEGATHYLGDHVDPEISPDTALLALASAQLRLDQPARLLAMIGPTERAHLKNPQLKALVGIALLQTGDNAGGKQLIADAQAEQPDNNAIRSLLARHYLSVGETTAAIDLLQHGLAKSPQEPGLRRLLIAAYLTAGKVDQALSSAQGFATTAPTSAEYAYLYGHVALFAKRYDVAASALQKALTLRADYPAAQMDLAQIDLILQQPQPALARYKALLTKDGGNAAALKGFVTAQEMLIGRAAAVAQMEALVLAVSKSNTAQAVVAEYYLNNQRLADAQRLLAQIPVSAEEPYPAYVKQMYADTAATLAMAVGDHAAARLAIVEGLNINARNPRLLTILAKLEIQQQQPAEAEKIIAQLATVQPNSTVIADLKADLAAAGKQWDQAIAEYRQLWQTTRSDAIAAKLYRAVAANNPGAAEQFLKEWRTTNASSDQPYIFEALAAQKKDNDAAAIQAYQNAIAHNAQNPASLNNLALLYQKTGDARALATAEQAYRLAPGNPIVLDTYGWLLVNNKQVEKGTALLEQAAALVPSSTEIAGHLQQAKKMR